MSKKYYLLVALIVVAGIVVASFTVQKSSVVPEKTPVTLTGEETTEIKWYSVNEALALHEKTGKKLFIDVYTNWCGPCKWLDQNTFHHPVIMDQLEKYYIPVKFNAEGNDTIVFNGNTFVNPNPEAGPRRSIHQFTQYIASTERGISYPTMVFLNEQLEMIQPITGALGPDQMEPILEFIGADHYLSTPWEDYLQTFQSNIE
ncbi:MAG: thioredoxin family protein [Chitinophagales bacterium]|nr:thioredoxin family protein [Chitinophagales bacterium]HAE13585.1 hypothetical protein [Bacteroidota bacterium]MCB9019845.1 thioredoxin family protein [Chitinophagales bacterium]MCB9022691.1 thioredoxin family protein [Chitinophagales bacterium]HPE98490.1 thioredoxin family protein [Chitinophagales bacterium]